MTILISAIICTYNRADYLPKAIQSLVEQTFDASEYEIIVVDNHSTDNTKQIVTEQFSHVSNLRYLYEPIQGLSQARNTGWQNAEGEYVAYLDDDAIASPQWLEIIVEVFQTIKPTPGVTGGKIEPIWESPPPSWLSDNLKGALTIIDWSETPIFLEGQQWLAGANIAYPKNLLEEYGGFDTNLGRKGKKLLSCEENLLHEQLKTQGYRMYYHPQIAVKHHIPTSRLDQKWHHQRQYWNGVSLAVIDLKVKQISMKSRLKLLRRLTGELVKDVKQMYFNDRKNSGDDLGFAEKCKISYKLGYILATAGIIR